MKVSDLHIGKCASNHVIKQSFASKFMTWTFVQTYVNHYLWHSEDDIQKPSRHSRNTIVSTLQVFTAKLSSSFPIGFSSGPTNTSKECHMNCCSKPLCFMFVLSCIVLNMIVLHLTDQSKAHGELGCFAPDWPKQSSRGTRYCLLRILMGCNKRSCQLAQLDVLCPTCDLGIVSVEDNHIQGDIFTVTLGLVGWGKGVLYLALPGRPTDIGLLLGKACYSCSK